VPADTPRIVLAHNPFLFEQLSGRRCDLMLSGHTHGGQVQLPGRGPLVLHPKMRDYAAGLYAQNNARLYVNKGIGFTVRFRFQTRPEIAVLRLTTPKSR
jgi:predicted MPP superfamily phosphohydrolase